MSEKHHPLTEKGDTLRSKEQEEAEEAAKWMEDYPPVEVTQDSPEKQAEKIRELERLLSDFEQKHDFDALYSAVVRTREEAKAHTVREAAMADLPALVNLINYLEQQGLLSAYSDLHARYRAIQRNRLP